MKASSLIGLAIAIGGLFLGSTMEGSNPMAVINVPAILIVLGGTFGATMMGTSFDAVKSIPKLIMKAFIADPPDSKRQVTELVGFAEKARRDGLLALDEQLADVGDAYTRKGLQLVVDGTDPDLVADVLETENDNMKKRHQAATQPFEKAGGYAPTMGIIGTVFGLIHVLQNLDAPATLGPMISAAFIATLLGVASSNVFFLPIAARLKQLSTEELQSRAMVLEGVLAIQAGDNPRVVAEKLWAFVPPAKRETEDDGQGGPSSPSDSAKDEAARLAA